MRKMEKLESFCRIVRFRIKTLDEDWIHVIEGKEGVGKTSLAWSMCKSVMPGWKGDTGCVFSSPEFIQNTSQGEPGDACNVDEGAHVFFSRESMATPNRDAVKHLTSCRQFNRFIVICVPSFMILDKYIRMHRVRSMSRVTKRGQCLHYGPGKVGRIKPSKRNPLKIDYPDYDFRDDFPDAAEEWPDEWAAYKEKKAKLTTEPLKQNGELHENTKTCDRCGYSWPYKGKNPTTTCPSCGYKTGYKKKKSETI